MAGESFSLGFQSLKFRFFRACLSFVSKRPGLTSTDSEFMVAPGAAPHSSARAPPSAAFLCIHQMFALFGEPRSFAKVRICQCFLIFFFFGQSFSYHLSYRFRSCFTNTMGFNFKLGNSLLLYDSTEISILIPFHTG